MTRKRSKILRQRRISLGLKNSRSGFTLIEMLVVVFVVGIGLVGALSFFNINLNNQFEVKNELIAAGLAQESSDLVRNIADYNYLNGQVWYTEIIMRNAIDPNYCKNVDRDVLYGDRYKCKNIAQKPAEVCFSPTSGVYSQSKNCPGNQITTDFSRSLEIEGSEQNGTVGIDLDAGDCIKVTATVTWSGRETKSTDIICNPRE